MAALRAALTTVHGTDMLTTRATEERGVVRPFEESEVTQGIIAGPSASKRRRIGTLQVYESIMTL